jgi:hypothetical protein
VGTVMLPLDVLAVASAEVVSKGIEPGSHLSVTPRGMTEGLDGLEERLHLVG